MALKRLFDLQLFAEGGGDGGASAAGGESSASMNETVAPSYPKNIPDRAKKYYDMAAKKTQKVDTAAKETAKETKPNTITTTEEENPANSEASIPKKLSFGELIESEDYKAEYERHIRKAVRDRMKTHEAERSETNELLSLVGQKYGLDTKSENFRTELANAIKADDSYYEKYAQEHDVPLPEAKRLMGLEAQLAKAEEQAKLAREQQENDRVINALRDKGAETKKLYPEFDLDTAMKDERFKRLTVAFGGDTTQAYKALNHDALQRKAVAEAESRAQAAVSNAVKSNLSRPSEGGISSTSNNAPATPDFKSMGLTGLRAWASQQRNRTGR